MKPAKLAFCKNPENNTEINVKYYQNYYQNYKILSENYLNILSNSL